MSKRLNIVRRSTVLVNSHLEKNLVAYMASACAAGVGLLAASPSAQAKVVYTRQHFHRTKFRTHSAGHQ